MIMFTGEASSIECELEDDSAINSPPVVVDGEREIPGLGTPIEGTKDTGEDETQSNIPEVVADSLASGVREAPPSGAVNQAVLDS